MKEFFKMVYSDIRDQYKLFFRSKNREKFFNFLDLIICILGFILFAIVTIAIFLFTGGCMVGIAGAIVLVPSFYIYTMSGSLILSIITGIVIAVLGARITYIMNYNE